MTEPVNQTAEPPVYQTVNRWEPVTKEYESQAAQVADIQAEHEQRLRELHEKAKAQKPPAEKKAPLGIRIFTWYYTCRAALYAILLLILLFLPKAGPNSSLAGRLDNYLQTPGKSNRDAQARMEEMRQRMRAQGYQIPDEASGQDAAAARVDAMRNLLMVYLLFLTGVTTVVSCMWWFRNWRVRWATMCYAGAFVAKFGINYFSGVESGVKTEIPPEQMPFLFVSLVINGIIFCYLAFWPGVKEWFEGAA